MMGENWDLYIQKTERWERKEVAQEKERERKKENTELISKIHPVDKVPQRIKEQLFSFIFLAKLDTLSTHDDILYRNMIWSVIYFLQQFHKLN